MFPQGLDIGMRSVAAENMVLCPICGVWGVNPGHCVSMVNLKCWSGMEYTVMEIALWPPMTWMESGRRL